MKSRLWRFEASQVLGMVVIVTASLLGLLIPLQLRSVIDGSSQDSVWPLVLLLLLFFTNAILLAFGQVLMATSGERQVAKLRQALISRFYRYPMSFFSQQKSGELSSRVVNDTLAIRDFLVRSVPGFVASMVTLFGSVIVLLWLDLRMSLCLFIGLPSMLLFIIPLSKLAEKSTFAMQEETSRLTGVLTESFQEVALIKGQTAEDAVVASQTDLIANIRRYAIKNDRLEAFESPFAMLFIFGIMSAIFWYGGRRVAEETLTVGTLISFMVYLLQLLNPVGSISSTLAEYAKQKGATATLQTLLEQPLEQTDGDSVQAFDKVSFNHVSFSYGDQKVLEDISLHLEKGKKMALVGPSGSGKSTLISLLLRFYPVSSGNITVGHQNIADLNLYDWRNQIALVAQSQALLAGSIRDNLCFGLNRSVTDNELKEALEMASLTRDLEHLPDGLDSQVGERGQLLSGGQKQRLQIARAYLQHSPILIFDEATANLDADAEYQISQSLNAVVKDKLGLIVAHRLSTVVDADCIYFIENHKVTGTGTHQELLATHETYARFVREQML